MEFVLLLFCIGIGVAAKSALDHGKSERTKSGDAKAKAAEKAAGGKLPKNRARALQARHETGWWAREIAGGFPVHRTGWHAGWLAHSRESRHQRHIREEARTGDLEAKAAYGPALRAHKKRQQALRDEILAGKDGTAPVGRKAVREASDAVVLHPDFPRAAPAPAPDELLEPTGTDGPAPTRRVDGQPETDADRRFFDARESGYRGPLDQDGHPIMSRTDGDGNPLPLFEGGTGTRTPDDPEWPAGIPHRRRGDASPAAPDGGTVSETTFTTVIESAKGSAAAAEGSLAGIKAQREHYERMADEMQALDVDSGNLSAVMDIVDGYRKAEEAMAGLQDTASALPQGLQRDHGQVDEAVREQPVRMAQRGFYGEGDG